MPVTIVTDVSNFSYENEFKLFPFLRYAYGKLVEVFIATFINLFLLFEFPRFLNLNRCIKHPSSFFNSCFKFQIISDRNVKIKIPHVIPSSNVFLSNYTRKYFVKNAPSARVEIKGLCLWYNSYNSGVYTVINLLNLFLSGRCLKINLLPC